MQMSAVYFKMSARSIKLKGAVQNLTAMLTGATVDILVLRHAEHVSVTR